MIAFEIAKMSQESKTPLPLAILLKEVFSEILIMPEIVTDETKRQFAEPISETLIDFAYASKMTENMSLRLMQYQQE